MHGACQRSPCGRAAKNGMGRDDDQLVNLWGGCEVESTAGRAGGTIHRACAALPDVELAYA